MTGRAWPTLEALAAEEAELRWPAFDEDDAWRLGVSLVTVARERRLPVAVDVSRGDHRLFHAGLPGSTPDNDAWLERKARVVARFHHSSLYVGQLCRDAGRSLQQMFHLPEDQYAAHGGAFPVTVAGTGVVGCVAVSGLPQLEDHELVVEVLRRMLGGAEAVRE